MLVQTLEQLCEAYPDRATPDLAGPVRRVLQERSDHLAEEARKADLHERISARIRNVASKMASGPWDEPGWEFVEEGLRREYRRGRDAFAAASRDPQSDDVHDWRKRVKDHWYHLRLLKKAWPPLLKKTAKEAHELSDLLGDEHDLVVLGETLRDGARASWDAAPARTLVRLAERRRGEILADAVPLGDRLYAEKPSRFTARMHRYWEVAAAPQEERREVPHLSVAAGA